MVDLRPFYVLVAITMIATSCGDLAQMQVVGANEPALAAIQVSFPEPDPHPREEAMPLKGGTNLNVGSIEISPTAFQCNTPGDDFVFQIKTPMMSRTSFRVQCFINDQLIKEQLVATTGQSWSGSVRWESAYAGDHVLRVVVDPKNVVAETNEEDNEYILAFSISE